MNVNQYLIYIKFINVKNIVLFIFNHNEVHLNFLYILKYFDVIFLILLLK